MREVLPAEFAAGGGWPAGVYKERDPEEMVVLKIGTSGVGDAYLVDCCNTLLVEDVDLEDKDQVDHLSRYIHDYLRASQE